MIPFFAASILSCSEANWILDGVKGVEIDSTTRSEIIATVMNSTEKDCQFTGSDRNSGR